MKDKFTPGPWCAVEYSGKWTIQTEQSYNEEADLLNEANYAAAADNAKLAAAAPDMLAALKLVASSISTLDPCYMELVVAINKATL